MENAELPKICNKTIDFEIVGSRYKIIEQIGAGCFGQIYKCEHLVNHDLYAIKLEENTSLHSQLKKECKIYRSISGSPGIPIIHWDGTEGNYRVLVMDLLDKSLEDLLQLSPNKCFSLKTVLMIADQILLIIQYLHEKNYIHRDIKPENIMIGSNKNNNQIYLIDFGLAKKYRDPKTHQHIPYLENKELTGTARYVSVNTHLRIEQSRRDDLESIGYVLIYLLVGRLPWQGFQATTTKEKLEKIADAKMSISYEKLCESIPHEFVTYFQTVRYLEFDERPPYEMLRKNFRDLFIRMNFTYDYVYDWTVIHRAESSQNVLEVHVPEIGKDIMKLPALGVRRSLDANSNRGIIHRVLVNKSLLKKRDRMRMSVQYRKKAFGDILKMKKIF
ncbi:Casein kinase I isoform delta-like protein [Histomonas meleagridis]|uniref:Casein kinase I isoform delta-like protein n=1 Tax=Histomonas meleagridis TaxID=135588 RepID=UPI003559F8FA|nr:Casein kinase I isoform delta-like protein [Histomonas meleagridis]KAH0802447.1 Casein kinase I isoform delta-like protein [Histomonas meleagridis]